MGFWQDIFPAVNVILHIQIIYKNMAIAARKKEVSVETLYLFTDNFFFGDLPFLVTSEPLKFHWLLNSNRIGRYCALRKIIGTSRWYFSNKWRISSDILHTYFLAMSRRNFIPNCLLRFDDLFKLQQCIIS